MADDPAATAASNNPELSTLVAAVTAADLVDTLNSAGPFTIFAPVNSAFAKIPKADLDEVLADKDLLTSILAYHVVPEQLDSERARRGRHRADGQRRRADDRQGRRHLRSTVTRRRSCARCPTANATVYLIDTVLMPPA